MDQSTIRFPNNAYLPRFAGERATGLCPSQGVVFGFDSLMFRVSSNHPSRATSWTFLRGFVVNAFSGWLRRDFLHTIAGIAEGSA
jgi:hypothetical protein